MILLKVAIRERTHVVRMYHPAGRALTSDWSVNSFIMVVYENVFYSCFGKKVLTELKKKFS